ncbi:MAG: hypothetical protein ACFCGT_20135 [Sandaracinaceae bacterium]
MRHLSTISSAVAMLALAACTDPGTDATRLDGGNAPVPTGVMEGTVVYAGPRPPCVREDDGTPVRVLGRAVLLLFLASNPPPPEGSSTSAVNLLFVEGDQLFGLEDCATGGAADTPITRSTEFVWPTILLGPAPPTEDGDLPPIDYQVRAFYDTDEDFDPFFGVRRSSTRGDVSGGALVPGSEPPRFSTVRFDNLRARPNGQRVVGVTVTLGAPVGSALLAYRRTEETVALSSEATTPLDPDAARQDELLWRLMSLRLELLDPEGDAAPSLERAGLSIDASPAGRGFFVAPVDVDRDGTGDLHPVLGSTGLPWLLPIVVLDRARNPSEVAAGVPPVRFVATVRPGRVVPPAMKVVFAPTIEISVPPVALASLRPGLPQCDIPIVAPGSVAETYEGRPTECQELPTGNYTVTALGGLAGATPVDVRARLREEMPGLSEEELDAAAAQITDTGFALEGGGLASQSWSLPNELGCPDFDYLPAGQAVNQLDDDPSTSCEDPDTLMLRAQGPDGRVSVVDPDPSNGPDPADTSDGRGVPTCQQTLRLSTGMIDTVTYVGVPPECCEPVLHLCGLPLCSLRERAVIGDATGIRDVREGSGGLDDDGRPSCVPFHMPVSCCR